MVRVAVIGHKQGVVALHYGAVAAARTFAQCVGPSMPSRAAAAIQARAQRQQQQW